jgi:antitoxin ParD1/3/4
MHVSLTPQLEAYVKAKVATGLYNNASEVIREAIRFMESHEEWIYQIKLEKLKSEVKKGLDQLNNGNCVDGPQYFETLNQDDR